jgi:hypothetical protein
MLRMMGGICSMSLWFRPASWPCSAIDRTREARPSNTCCCTWHRYVGHVSLVIDPWQGYPYQAPKAFVDRFCSEADRRRRLRCLQVLELALFASDLLVVQIHDRVDGEQGALFPGIANNSGTVPMYDSKFLTSFLTRLVRPSCRFARLAQRQFVKLAALFAGASLRVLLRDSCEAVTRALSTAREDSSERWMLELLQDFSNALKAGPPSPEQQLQILRDVNFVTCCRALDDFCDTNLGRDLFRSHIRTYPVFRRYLFLGPEVPAGVQLQHPGLAPRDDCALLKELVRRRERKTLDLLYALEPELFEQNATELLRYFREKKLGRQGRIEQLLLQATRKHRSHAES